MRLAGWVGTNPERWADLHDRLGDGRQGWNLEMVIGRVSRELRTASMRRFASEGRSCDDRS